MLNNKTVLITGASSGIGLACAHSFAKQGAKLILCARSYDKLVTIASELKSHYNVLIHILELDVTQATAVKESLTTLSSPFQKIDILINNAGLAQGLDKIYEANIQDWEKMIDTNIKGLLYVSRIVIENMVKHNSGHIINMGSLSSHQVYSGGTVYCATKFAVKALTRGMQMDVQGTPIKISEVDPGMVNTNFSLTRFKGDKNAADAIYENKHPLTAEDIAETVLFCATRPAHVNIAEIIILSLDGTPLK
ncbi:MAG: NAD(P)-dependent oxidoreductase [Gammaproteobacteria bacterium RIFCSPHIGHO2_12_FULL_35_23]|nr:MAG: NAD(P)-dependent oxidoreductase [Gammaproteobacteria bacterium RIFCSPHIGHO2_12_FULL_35_23]